MLQRSHKIFLVFCFFFNPIADPVASKCLLMRDFDVLTLSTWTWCLLCWNHNKPFCFFVFFGFFSFFCFCCKQHQILILLSISTLVSGVSFRFLLEAFLTLVSFPPSACLPPAFGVCSPSPSYLSTQRALEAHDLFKVSADEKSCLPINAPSNASGLNTAPDETFA